MRLLLIGLCLILAGCGAQTTGKNICPDIRIDVRDSSYVTISPGLETLSGDTPLEVRQPTEFNISPDINLSLTPEQQLVEAGKSLAAAKIAEEAVKVEEAIPDVPVITPDKKKVVPGVYETAKFHNRNSENDRPIWYFKKPMKDYPTKFRVVIDGCGTINVDNKGERVDFDKNYKRVNQQLGSAAGGTFISQSRMPSRNYMTMVGPASCKSTKAYIPTEQALKVWETYDVDVYKDGRPRYLLRGTMEDLPDNFTVRYKGTDIFSVDKKDPRYTITDTGGRWESDGRLNTVLKNSHGRVNSITLLLKGYGSNPKRSDVTISGR